MNQLLVNLHLTILATMTDIFFTQKRKAELQTELDNLQGVERGKIATEIETAKAHGDLSENAEYHAAREKQAKMEDRITEIQYMLNHGRIAETTNTNQVQVGHQVVVKNTNTDQEFTYTIVGMEEQDIMQGLISNNSPIAVAVLGKSVNDKVYYETPAGKTELQIVSIANPEQN